MTPSRLDGLPFVDEHVAVIAADAATVWTALVEVVERMASTRPAVAYARLVGCADQRPAGPRPLAAGSVVAGFHVVAAAAGQSLDLAGRHRFSVYALSFRLEPVDGGRTRLRAEHAR